MIDGLKSYSSMKDSGVPWLGEVPGHWEVRRMKYLLREHDERSSAGTEQLLRVSQFTGITERRRETGGDEPDTRAESLVGYKLVEPEDLVVNIMLAWNGSMGVSRFSGIASPAYCVYRFNTSAKPWYFHHLLRSPVYKARIKAVSTGVVESRLRLYTDDLYCIEGLLPPPDEQAAIVKYLDYVDRRIRRYIRAKQKQIKLLEEQKQAIIHRAVTGQIDVRTGRSYPAYKPSGVEWLGDVPEHWKVEPFGRSIRVNSGDMISADDERESGVPIYGGNGIRGYTFKANSIGPIILLGRVGAKCGCVHLVDGQFWASEHALRVIVKTDVDLKFLAKLLAHADLNRFAIRTAQPLINSTIVRNHRVAFPPLEEQAAIVHFLDESTTGVASAIDHVHREIDLLREYRSRLVADVVTGKLDVREPAAKLPDEKKDIEITDDVGVVEGEEEAGIEDGEEILEENG